MFILKNAPNFMIEIDAVRQTFHYNALISRATRLLEFHCYDLMFRKKSID